MKRFWNVIQVLVGNGSLIRGKIVSAAENHQLTIVLMTTSSRVSVTEAVEVWTAVAVIITLIVALTRPLPVIVATSSFASVASLNEIRAAVVVLSTCQIALAVIARIDPCPATADAGVRCFTPYRIYFQNWWIRNYMNKHIKFFSGGAHCAMNQGWPDLRPSTPPRGLSGFPWCP